MKYLEAIASRPPAAEVRAKRWEKWRESQKRREGERVAREARAQEMAKRRLAARHRRAEEIMDREREAYEARREIAEKVLGVKPPDWASIPKGARFCRPEGPRCNDSRDYAHERRACCVAINREMIRFAGDVLTALGCTWWADYGTLLGAVRHGRMIPWDKDNDVGILEEDAPKLIKVDRELREIGIGTSMKMRSMMKLHASPRNHTNVDVFQWRARNGKMTRRVFAGVDNFKGKNFPESWLLPLTTVTYDGLILPAPAAVRLAATPVPAAFECFDAEIRESGSRFLEHRYGSPKDTKRPWWVGVHANNDGVRRP